MFPRLWTAVELSLEPLPLSYVLLFLRGMPLEPEVGTSKLRIRRSTAYNTST